MATAKYISIAQKIISDIDSGYLEVNAALPSLRSCTQIHKISMTTAIACYRYLEKHGYAVSEEKKGFYAQTPVSPSTPLSFPNFESHVVSLNRPQNESKQEIFSSCSLGQAQLDGQLIDQKILKRSLKAATKLPDFNLNYDSPQGNLKLRNELSKLFIRQGLPNSVSEISITHGCLDAVLIALECTTKPGDVIAVSSPCYSGLLDILSILERTVLEIPSTESGLDLVQLEKAMASKQIKACLLTANYQNPTGHSLSNQQKRVLAQLANQYQIPIIEDDVFRELSHHRTVPLPIKYYDEAGWVLWCSSVSKSLAPGFRIGWCLAGRYTKQYVQQRYVRTLGHNTPLQLALGDYICCGYYEKHLKKVNRILNKHTHHYLQFFRQRLPKYSSVITPTGGLVIWINVPQLNTVGLTEVLAKKGIDIKPGNLFSTTDLYNDCFRINIGGIPSASLNRKLEILCEEINKLIRR